MFCGENPLLEGRGSIVGHDRNLGLTEHLASIELLCHNVDGAAADLVAGFDGPLMSVQTAIFRQQGGMDVENPSAPFLDKPRGENSHEAGKGNRADTEVVECRAHYPIKFFLAGPAALESPGLKAGLSGPIEPR